MRTLTKAGLLAGAAALLVGSRRRTGTEIDRGPVTDPSRLPRPQLFPAPTPGQQPEAFRGLQDEQTSPTPYSRPAWIAVAAMVLGVVLVGLAVALRQWPLLAAGLLVGAVGVVLAVKARIMEEVSVTDSPEGRS